MIEEAAGARLATMAGAGTAAAPREARELLGRRNDRLLLVAVASYAALLCILTIARGVSVTPDVVVLGLGLAALILGRGRLFFRDWSPFLALFLAYELMRGYADRFGLPIHVTDVIALERVIGLGGLPTVWLQSLLHRGGESVPDPLAAISVGLYFLHFPLPLAVGVLLWIRRRRIYYDYVGALIVLSVAAFVTYLLLPVAPPWWAERQGDVTGVLHLRDNGFAGLAGLFGIGNHLYSYPNLYSVSSNDVAAFPSLHAAYPFLAFLFARRAFPRAGWLMLAYAACVWFSIVYLGEHWVVDIVGGVAYSVAAYLAVLHGPASARWLMARIIKQGTGAASRDEGGAAAPRPAGRRIRWALVMQGLATAGAGAMAVYGMQSLGWLGGSSTIAYPLSCVAIPGGLWRGAVGLFRS